MEGHKHVSKIWSGTEPNDKGGSVALAFPSALPYHDLVFLLLSFRLQRVALR
jgi:hypothetical protein